MKRLLVVLLFLFWVTTPAWADYESAMAAYKQADYTTAVKELRPLAEQGEAKAQNTLGWMYREGQGVTKDYNEALKWFQKAADQGFAKALNNLGIMYETGVGVKQDGAEALKWFRKAADQGDAWGQNNVAMLYKDGKRGSHRTRPEAVEWFRKAADQGLLQSPVPAWLDV